MPNTGRIRELDGLRGLAIALVIVWHYLVCQVTMPSNGPFALPMKLLQATWSGVDLFFVLSGFLIGGILLDNSAARHVFSTFYIRRACRILPLYLVMLGLFFVLSAGSPPAYDWLFAAPMPFTSYATFTQNAVMGARQTFGPHWLGITWSLAVEEQFYLLLPLLIVALPRRLLPATLVALVLAAPLARAAIGGLGAYVYPFCRSDSILMGVLCALAVRHPAWSASLPRWRALLTRGVAVFLAVFMVFSAAHKFKTGGIATHFILGIGYSIVLLWVMALAGLRQTLALRSTPLIWTGERSYGIYLFHQPVAGALHGGLYGTAPHIDTWDKAGVTAASLVVTVALVELSFRTFEKFFLDRGHRFKYRPEDVTPPLSRPSAMAGVNPVQGDG